MISQSRYIRIVSGVGAGAAVAQRKLTLRVITDSDLVPPGVVMEFGSADDVATYFGVSSAEAQRAYLYFGFISKQINSPREMSFSRFLINAIPAMIVGDTETKLLASLTPFSAAVITLNYGGTQYLTDPIDLSGATSLTNVATLLQAGINGSASVASVPALATSTVTYNTNTNQFTLTAGVSTAGSGTLSAVFTSQPTDPSTVLGWTTTGAVNVPGANADTPVSAIQRSVNVSNNFGSFLFETDYDLAEATAVAAWNHARNNEFMYLSKWTYGEAGSVYTAMAGYSGAGVMLYDAARAPDYIDQFPAEILAATNYNQPNAVQNYMYYQSASRLVTVEDDQRADVLDNLRFNYMGVTQSAGQSLAFFQRGVLMGDSAAATDMNTYANEMWLKSAITQQLFSMFLNLGRVPANEDGAATIQAIIQVVIDNAKVNGTISVGKPFTEVQKQYITQITADDTSWRQVQTIGYWLTVGFDTEVVGGKTEYFATYTLIYSKDDVVRRVDGRDIMI